ncbi:nucleotide-binding universal stress UspA family protein [Catenulispora sp. EB89]|uniref:universal stress protein n=1 Tax=Catenulispora sp. EB89 TaxID=3156257 RepID=UPI003515F827
MTGPVVVGIDDFEHCDHLVAAAVREAQLRETALWLAHAYYGYAPIAQGLPPGYTPNQVLRDAAEEQLRRLATKLQTDQPELHLQIAAVAGPAAPALAEVANLASLLVVGGRGRGGLAGQLLGSVSLRVLAHADCPVLVVRGDRDPATNRVLLALDADGDPATGPEVLEFAFVEAARRNADLYAFTVWEDPLLLYAYGTGLFAHDQRNTALRDGRERLAATLAPWKEMHPQLKVSSDVLAGLPAKLLVEATELADLVVIGGRAHRDGEGGMRVGAIAHTVLHHAQCPVAIVPEH